MIYNRLNTGFPRPNIEESINLYSILYPNTGIKKAYHYFLQRLASNADYDNYIRHADKYIESYQPNDIDVIKAIAETRLTHRLKGLPLSLKQVDRALEGNINNSTLIHIKCKVLRGLGLTDQAREYAKKSLKKISEGSKEYQEILSYSGRNS